MFAVGLVADVLVGDEGSNLGSFFEGGELEFSVELESMYTFRSGGEVGRVEAADIGVPTSAGVIGVP